MNQRAGSQLRHQTKHLALIALVVMLLLGAWVMTAVAGPQLGRSWVTPRTAQVGASPVPVGQDPSPTNLISNGGFEDDLAYWSVEGEGVPSGRDPYQGVVSLQVGFAGGYAGQRVAIQPGITYRLSVWGKVDAVGDAGYVGVTFRNAASERLTEREPRPLAFTKRDYLQQSLEFRVDDSVAIVTLFVFKESGPAQFFVDEIVVVPLDPVAPTGSPVASPSPG